jgi:ubiquitin carboxyl-terminal hydrolase 25/28
MYRQQISLQSADGKVEAQEPVESVFVHPIIGVEEEGKDLYDCLAELYLRGSEIEYEGKKGYIMDLMDRFPPMLYIQMRVSELPRGADVSEDWLTICRSGPSLTSRPVERGRRTRTSGLLRRLRWIGSSLPPRKG